MLISGVLPIMALYRLPHGQYGYSGHVINLRAAQTASKRQATSQQRSTPERKRMAAETQKDYSRKVPVNVKEWQLKPPRREKDYSG